MSQQLSIAPPSAALSMFHSLEMFELVQRQADYISKSDMIPKEFRGKPENCGIALEISNRLGASVFQIMQSMDVIHGRPSWRAKFLIGMVNSCGRFGPLQFEMTVDGPERKTKIEYFETEGFGQNAKKISKTLDYTYTPTTCRAHATSRVTGETVYGPPVSYDLAIAEGWVAKAGSKWQTPMRELMLMYRAGAWFANLHASDVTMGMQTAEEAHDVGPLIDVESTVIPTPAKKTEKALKNPYVSEEAKPEIASPSVATIKETPAAATPKAASTGTNVAEATPPRGRKVYYEKVEVKNGESNGKPWKKYTVHYSVPGGGFSMAATFSSDLVAPIENCDEGVAMMIETTPNPNPKYPETLTFLEILPEESN